MQVQCRCKCKDIHTSSASDASNSGKVGFRLMFALIHLHSHLEICEARANTSARCVQEKENKFIVLFSCICIQSCFHYSCVSWPSTLAFASLVCKCLYTKLIAPSLANELQLNSNELNGVFFAFFLQVIFMELVNLSRIILTNCQEIPELKLVLLHLIALYIFIISKWVGFKVTVIVLLH